MPIAFGSPLFLLLAPPLLLMVWLMSRRSLAGLERGRRRVALGLRMLVVLLLVLSLAEIQWRDLTKRVEVVFVLDHSRSIPDEQTQKGLELIEASRRRMNPLLDLGKVVVFGRDASTEARLLPGERRLSSSVTSAVQRDHTNLEEGISHALQAIEPDARGRIVVLSDGNATAGDLGAALARARAAQVPIDVVPLDYAYEKELLVEKLVLPDEIKAGEPFLARVVVNATRKTRARVSLFQEGAVLQSQELTLEPGPNVAVFQLQFDRPEFFRVRAVAESLEAGGDQLYQNNAAHGFVFARGKASVLLLHDEEDPEGVESQFLLRALEAEQIQARAMLPSQFPLEPLELQSYDAIILDDVDRSSLSEAQQLAIESAVGNMGVGLIMIGGERSFGAGDWRGSPVEQALPVEMDIKQEEVIPDGALVTILHSCEMAEGNALAIKTCQKSVDALSAKDWYGLLHYGSDNEWAVPLVQARDKVGIRARIAKIQPGDMPDFDGIFRMALKALRGINASVKHMLILSDGDPSPPGPELLKQCKDQRITVSTVCYFAHGGSQGAESQNMRRIANMTGGKYYYLDDAKKLPQIFLKESQRVARSLIVNATFQPIPRTKSPVLTGFDGFPTLTGYVLTEPKPRAEVALVSPENAPILAHWQYGVGRSLAFTSDAKPLWAAQWVQWGGYRSFWAQAVRWVAKEVQGGSFQVATSVRGDRGVVALDAMTSDGDLIEGLSVMARVSSPREGEKPIQIELVQKGPGRYEGEFPLGEVGTYNVHLMTREDGKLRHSVTTGLVAPYSDEFKRLRTDRPALQNLANAGGGRLIEPQALLDGDVDPWDRTALAERIALEERWPWVLAAALLLFLVDVALRRVAIDWDKLFQRVAAAVRRGPAAAQPQRTMERLREKKAEVREERAEATSGRAKFDASAAPPPSGPIQVAGTQAPPAAPTPPTPPAGRVGQPKKQEGSLMDRLREAKRRAQDTTQRPEDGSGGSGDGP